MNYKTIKLKKKAVLAILVCFAITGCETVKCAKSDWDSFNKNVIYWNTQPVVKVIK